MDSSRFATLLRQARKDAGLSQVMLARRAGLTGSYISFLESSRRRPPAPDVIAALCEALGIPDRALQEAAVLERSPPPVRKRLERMRRERGRVQRSRDRLLTTTLFHLAKGPRVVDPLGGFLDLPPGEQAVLGRLLGRFRAVQSVHEAEAKSEDLLQGTSARERDALVEILPRALVPPTRAPEDEAVPAPAVEAPFVRVPVYEDAIQRSFAVDGFVLDARYVAPDAFFWPARGSDAHPRVEDGDLLLVAPPEGSLDDGALVVFEHEGRARVGILRRQGHDVQIAFPRPEIPPLRLEEASFHPLGAVTLIVRAP